METRTRVPTYAPVLCLAARLTLNFVAPSLWRTHLVCQPLQVALSNKWSWVRADNTGHVDLVNLSRGILQNPCDTEREVLRSTNTTLRRYFRSLSHKLLTYVSPIINIILTQSYFIIQDN